MKGKRTYILAALAVIYAVAGFLTGNLTIEQAGVALWAGLTAFSVRNAIK